MVKSRRLTSRLVVFLLLFLAATVGKTSAARPQPMAADDWTHRRLRNASHDSVESSTDGPATVSVIGHQGSSTGSPSAETYTLPTANGRSDSEASAQHQLVPKYNHGHPQLLRHPAAENYDRTVHLRPSDLHQVADAGRHQNHELSNFGVDRPITVDQQQSAKPPRTVASAATLEVHSARSRRSAVLDQMFGRHPLAAINHGSSRWSVTDHHHEKKQDVRRVHQMTGMLPIDLLHSSYDEGEIFDSTLTSRHPSLSWMLMSDNKQIGWPTAFRQLPATVVDRHNLGDRQQSRLQDDIWDRSADTETEVHDVSRRGSKVIQDVIKSPIQKMAATAAVASTRASGGVRDAPIRHRWSTYFIGKRFQ